MAGVVLAYQLKKLLCNRTRMSVVWAGNKNDDSHYFYYPCTSAWKSGGNCEPEERLPEAENSGENHIFFMKNLCKNPPAIHCTFHLTLCPQHVTIISCMIHESNSHFLAHKYHSWGQNAQVHIGHRTYSLPQKVIEVHEYDIKQD